MSRDEIIERIKKLLRMKRGGTDGEIENALAMAAKLAREHGIDLAGVNPDEQAQTVRHVEDALKSKLPLEARYAAAILVNFFNVNMVVRRSPSGRGCEWWQSSYQWSVCFIGSDCDIEIARYVFGFLTKHFRRSWAQRENRRLKNRAAFLEGMFLGLGAKLEKMRSTSQPDQAGLVLIGKALALRDQYVQQHWPKAGKQDLPQNNTGARAAQYAGILEGQKTQIRAAVEKPAAPAPAALPPPAGQLQLI